MLLFVASQGHRDVAHYGDAKDETKADMPGRPMSPALIVILPAGTARDQAVDDGRRYQVEEAAGQHAAEIANAANVARIPDQVALTIIEVIPKTSRTS